MSGGGGFRGRGFRPQGHRRQGSGPDYSGGSGSRNSPDARQGCAPGNFGQDSRFSGPNFRSDGPDSRLRGGFNAQGGPASRGPHQNFSHGRYPQRLPSIQPVENWSPRGGNSNFQAWRGGGRPPRFNTPTKPFFRGRGQGGQYMPRQQFPQAGNYGPPYMQYQQMPEPKPVEQKPAIPHLGSEEERQQKITEAADALKRKLSSVAREPAVWREDEYDTGVAEPSQNADQDSRIAHKGIPELRHDPPELNLTLGDLRDIGRVDHDHRNEQAKTNAFIDYACDESEVEILAHNPVRPMIEIDLWSDENYADFDENEENNTSTEDSGAMNEMECALDQQSDVFTSPYDFQSMGDNFTSFADDIMLEECREMIYSSQQFETSLQQDISSTEPIIELPNSEFDNQEPETQLQTDSRPSEGCDDTQERSVTESNVDYNNAEFQVETAEQPDELRETSEIGGIEIHSAPQQPDCLSEQVVTDAETPKDIVPEAHDKEAGELRDDVDKLNVGERKTEAETEIGAIENENPAEQQGVEWVSLSTSAQDDNTRIPGLDGVFENELMNESKSETEAEHNDSWSRMISNSESTIVERGLDRNISGLQREVATVIVEEKTKESQKELTSENRGESVTQSSDVCAQSTSRVSDERATRVNNTCREVSQETFQSSTDQKRGGELSEFGEKTSEAKPDASTSPNATVEKQPDETATKTSDTSKKRNKEDTGEKSQHSDSHKSEKTEVSIGRSEARAQRDSSNETSSRDKTEAPPKVDAPKDKSRSTIDKPAKVAAKTIADEPRSEISTDPKIRERQKLVERLPHGSIGPRNRARVTLPSSASTEIDRNYEISTPANRMQNQSVLSSVPADFDPKQPPPKIPSQEIPEIPRIPPVFDPRLSAQDRNALIAPNISSIPLDFGVNQGYAARTIPNFGALVPPLTYGMPTPQMIVGASIEPPTNIHPVCLGDPYQSLLSLPNVVTPIVIPVDNSMLLPPLPTEPPPPLHPAAKTNQDMDDGLEDMQEAMAFAKELMNMDESGGISDETNSTDKDFFHMPTFPDLPPIELPSLENIPTPPEVERPSVNRSTTASKESKKPSKPENTFYGPQPMPEESNTDTSPAKKTGEEAVNLTDDQVRPKVMFNLSSKSKMINKDNEWHQQHRDEAGETTAGLNTVPSLEIGKNIKIKTSPIAAAPALSKERTGANGQENHKKSLFTAVKSEAEPAKFNGSGWQIKLEEPQTASRSRSPPNATRAKQPKEPKNNEPSTSSECENSTRIITKDSTSKKSADDTPETLWKNRVIGRFLKMSSRDICNMLNNTSLRKFTIAMKHLVKEQRSTLSIGMRNNEEEKLKDTEAAYNREEFMDQISAMLDPNATVDLCNLPTQFIHQLSEVLQLESMSEFGAMPTEFTEALNSTQQSSAPIQPRQTRTETPPRQTQTSITVKKTRSSTPPIPVLPQKVSAPIHPKQTRTSSPPRQTPTSIPPQKTRSSTPPIPNLPQKVTTPNHPRQTRTSTPPRQTQTSIPLQKTRSSTPPIPNLPQKVSTPNLPIQTSTTPRQTQTSIPPQRNLPTQTSTPPRQTQTLIPPQRTQSSTPPTSTLPQKVSTPLLPRQIQMSTPSRQTQSAIPPERTQSSTPPISNLPQKSKPILPKETQVSAPPRKAETSIAHPPKTQSSTPSISTLPQKVSTPNLPREIQTSTPPRQSQTPNPVQPSSTPPVSTLAQKVSTSSLSKKIEMSSSQREAQSSIPVQKKQTSSPITEPPRQQRKSTPPRTTTRQSSRSSKESGNGNEAQDRRSKRREREKKSMNPSRASNTTPASTSQPTETQKPAQPSKEPEKPAKSIEDTEKNVSAVHRTRRRHQPPTIPDQQEPLTMKNGAMNPENLNPVNMADLDDIFTAGIAKTKKTTVDKTWNIERNPANPTCKEIERSAVKDPNMDTVVRAAVELDKIFAAGIAKAKLASKNAAAAAAARAAVANDGDDDPADDAKRKSADRRSNPDYRRPGPLSITRHRTRCEKWNQRKARENPDAFRNLTKEEWEAKYGETSDSTYEQEYRAIQASSSKRSPTSFRDSRDGFEDDVPATRGIMARLGNIVSSDSCPTENWTDSEESRPFRKINEPADCTTGAGNKSSEDGSNSSSTSSDSTGSSGEENEETPSVSKLLKVIKAREKVSKKRSVNEDTRDEASAEPDRKRRERGKISRKGEKSHKSRTKKGHRRKKEKKVKSKERKKRERKRKKRKSRRSGSEERSGSENEDTEDEESSELRDQQNRQLLTEDEIKKEDVVIVIKDEPENESELTKSAEITAKNAVTNKTTEESRPLPTKSLAPPAHTPVAGTSLSLSTSPMKTKAQLKQLPSLPTKIVEELSKECPKKQKNPAIEIPKENGEKIVEASPPVKKPKISLPSADTVAGNPSANPTASTSDDVALPCKSNSKKLDMSAYKERNRLRVHRENEKLRLIHENPSSLTQDLLNIPLTRKKVAENTETTVVQAVEQRKDPRTAMSRATAATVHATSPIIVTASAAASTVSNTPDKALTVGSATAKTPAVINTASKISAAGTITAETSTMSSMTAKSPATGNPTAKTAIISTATAKPEIKSTKIAKTPVSSNEPTKTPATSATTAKNPTEAIVPANPNPVPASLIIPVQQQQQQKPPVRKLIRRRSLTKPADTESSLAEARVEAGNKFAHIKSEGSKELKLREKLKKGGRQRVSSEGLETTIPLVKPPRIIRRPSIAMVTTAEDAVPVKRIIEVTRRCEYFQKGVQSDGFPDTVAQEFLQEFVGDVPNIKEIAEQPDLDSLSLQITELPVWPLEVPTSITGEIDCDESPPFKGFTKAPILRRDRVLTEAEINSDINASEAMPLAFEASVDSLPMSTVVDLNDLRSTSIALDEPICYGDEEFVEGRVEIESTLLGFTVAGEIPDDSEAIGALNDEFVVQHVEKSLEGFPEESRESLDILPRVTSTLSDSPAPVDFPMAEIQQCESIPSPLLVTESLRQDNDLLEQTGDFSTNNIEEKGKTINTSGDDAAEVTSSHESRDTATINVYVEATPREFETSSSISSAAVDKEVPFSTGATLVHDERKTQSTAEETQTKPMSGDSKDSVSNSTLSTVQTPPPQPTSSSDSTEGKTKDTAMTKQREVSETRDSETKSKESSHHDRSKSREHSHGDKSKKKSSRHHSHGLKSKKKGLITEKMVEEAVAANIVKLVPKPTSKDTVMARMIEIDVEIHKLMNEKMTLYKMLESGEFPAKEAADPEAKATNDSKTSNETEEIPEIVPLASRLARNLDKAVLPIPAIVHNESLKKSDGKKIEAEEARKSKRKKSPHREERNRAKDKSKSEGRRQRENSESKSHSRRTTSEESSRTETASTLSREKSLSSTELGDAEEKKNRRKTKSMQRYSPIRHSSKRSHEHSSKEDLGDDSRASSERSGKSAKQETKTVEESTKSKLRKKPKVLEAKKAETPKTRKEEKKSRAGSRASEKSETSGQKTIGERRIIYSDESTLDSVDPIQSDEQRGKKEVNSSTGLALLEESFKREMAKTRKLKAIEKRAGKKQEIQKNLKTNNSSTEEEVSLTESHERKRPQKTESLAASKLKEKSVDDSEVPNKILKHVTKVIDAVAKNRVEQLCNDDSSSGPEVSEKSLPTTDEIVTEKPAEEIAPDNVEETTETVKADEEEFEKAEESTAPDSQDSATLPESEQGEIAEENTQTEVIEAKDTEETEETPVATETVSGNEDLQEIPQDNATSDENTPKSDEAVDIVEDSVKKTELNISKEESTEEKLDDDDHQQNQQSTSSFDVVADEKEEIEEHQLSATLDESEPVVDQEKEILDKNTEDSDSPAPDVSLATSEPPEKADESRDNEEADEISPTNVIEETTENIEKSTQQRRSAKEAATERIRSKSRNRRSAKQRDTSTNSEKQPPLRAEESKIVEEKSSSRPKSATKRGQREKSGPPNRRSSRYSEDTGKRSRSRKRENSSSRGDSPQEGEPAKKKANLSQRSSSPSAQATVNEDPNRRRARKRKRRPEITRDEMTRCKVLLIDCKYTYLSPNMHPRILKKLGISKVNPYTPPSHVAEKAASPNRDETPSILSNVEVSGNLEEPSSSPMESPASPVVERPSSPIERPSSPIERPSSPIERPSSPIQRPSSPIERPSSPIERPSSPIERPSSPKEAVSSPIESPAPEKERSPSPVESPKESPPSPEEFPPSPKEDSSIQIVQSSSEMGNRVEVDEDDEEDDDVFDETIQIVKVADENLPPTNQSEEEELEAAVDDTEAVKDVTDNVDEPSAPPDSTADDIPGDEKNLQEADTTDEIEVLEEKSVSNDKPSEIQELPESEAEDENPEPSRTRYTVHKGPILDIKVLDDSFLAASEDGAIYRYSQTSNGILNIYKGHAAAVTCIYVLEVARKSWKLYSGSLDGTFRCYDITTGLPDRPPASVGSPIQCMDQAWGVFFVGTKSGHISRYNIKSGSIKGDRLEFSDKSVLALKACAEGPRRVLIVASRNQPITIRDALTGLFLRTICGYKNHTVYSLMRERNLVYCGTSSTSIPVFDFTIGEQVTQYNAGVGIVCMRLHRQILFAGCYDGNIYVFDTKETKLICSIPGPGNMLLSMEIVGDKIIAGSKNRQLHSWRMPKQVRSLLNARS